MIKWNITSRHKPGMTTERFYYEWAVIHVSLMLTNPSTVRTFRRYVQHFAFVEIPDAARLLPQHAEKWESFAEHWIDGLDAIPPSVRSEDYRGRMHPHTFSDSKMELHLLKGETVWQRDDFRSGGVKLIHALKSQPGQTLDAFEADWCGRHLPLLVETLRPRGLRKVVADKQLRLDAAMFKGTLFEKGGVDQYAGLEELWFDSLEAALAAGTDPAVRETLAASYARCADIAVSHSMVVIERVAFDFVTPGESTPLPAVLTPGTAEARAAAEDWKVFLPALEKR